MNKNTAKTMKNPENTGFVPGKINQNKTEKIVRLP